MCTVPEADRQRLITDNIGLAYAMAHKHRRMAIARGHDLEDVVQEASIALTIAAQHFDSSKGKYSSYACTSACRRLARLRNFSRLPTIPTPEDLSGLEFLPDSRESAPETQLDEAEQAQALATALQALSDREHLVLTLRFGLADGRERTLQEVGDALGVGKERARQLELRALARLRRALTS